MREKERRNFKATGEFVIKDSGSDDDELHKKIAFKNNPKILNNVNVKKKDMNLSDNIVKERSYGGFFGVDKEGTMFEEGTAVEGVPVIFYNDTIVCLNAKTAEIADMYVIEDKKRKCIAISDVTSNYRRSCMGLALHSNYGGDPVVGNWSKTKIEFGAGKLKATKESLDKPIKVEIEIFLPLQWCVMYKITIFNAGNKKLKGDVVFNFFLEEQTHKIIYSYYQQDKNATIFEIKGERNSYLVLQPNKKISHHTETIDILPPDSVLPIPLSDSPLPLLLYHSPVQVYQQIPLEIPSGEKGEIIWSISYDRDEKKALEKAQKSLSTNLRENHSEMRKYWFSKTSWVNCKNPLIDSFLKYLLMLLETNYEPTGRIVADLSGWGPAALNEKEWFSTTDTAIALLDIPLCPNLTPEYFKKIFSYTTDEKNKILKKEVIFRVRYEHYLRYPIAVYNYYLTTRDKDFLTKTYPILKNSLNYLQKNFTTKTGLLTIGVGYYDTFTFDGGMGADGKSVFAYQQVLAYEALKSMADISQILGEYDDKEYFLSWRRQIEQGLKTLWNGEYYSFTLEYDNFDVYANLWAIILNLVDENKKKDVLSNLVWTGMGFPQLHPPFPSETWFRRIEPYDSLQNGAMYCDVLGLVASAANLTEDADLLKKAFQVWKQLLTRYKYLPVVFNPWNPKIYIGTFRSEVHAISSFIRTFFSGLIGLRREGRNFALKPLMIEESGGLVEVKNFLWGSSHFDITVYGQEKGLKKLLVDEYAVPSEIIPAQFYDGKKHKVEVYSGLAETPQLITLGSGVYELRDINYQEGKLIFSLKGLSGEKMEGKVKTAGKAVKEVRVNRNNISFKEKEGICNFNFKISREEARIEISFKK